MKNLMGKAYRPANVPRLHPCMRSAACPSIAVDDGHAPRLGVKRERDAEALLILSLIE